MTVPDHVRYSTYEQFAAAQPAKRRHDTYTDGSLTELQTLLAAALWRLDQRPGATPHATSSERTTCGLWMNRGAA